MANFKDLIDQEYVLVLSEAIRKVRPKADLTVFKNLCPKLKTLELKARVQFVASGLEAALPDPTEGIPILIEAVEKADLRGFGIWPITHYIETVGLDHFDLSMDALYHLTQRFTAEFAIRPFLIRDQERSLKLLSTWAVDSNPHVRRLVSEGTRPRLPWGQRLPKFVDDPKPTLKLLERLKHDPELYVRKSIANHLNDISKDNPLIVVETLTRWNESAPKKHKKNVEWITRHALRTLIKSGHSKALSLIGVRSLGKALEVSKIRLKKSVITMGEELEFNFQLHSCSREELKLIVDYVIHHKKANGTTSEKVFKLRSYSLAAGETISVVKRHKIKPISTRKYYPGDHWIEIQVNGIRYGKSKWQLRL